MSKDCNHSNVLLKRNGTSQNQRYIDTLDPASVKLHDLSVEDMMAFAHDFAQKVNYFDSKTNTKKGNWEDFFIVKDQITDVLSAADGNGDLSPNLTLFVCFLKLLELSQDRLNGLTKKHLDFYYKEVLKLNRKNAQPDKVHLLFELAKNAVEVNVDAQTEADAGKDDEGNKRFYKTEDQLIVNQAKVAALKNIYHAEGKGVVYSEEANSFDGLGGDFPDGNIKWWPFGHPDFNSADGQPNLPQASLGFAIASPLLLLSEGSRNITFTIDFESNLPSNIDNYLNDTALDVFLSGEKEWVPAVLDAAKSGAQNKQLKLTVQLSEAADAIVPYSQEVLLENFSSTNPVARFLFKSGEDTTGYQLYQLLSGINISAISIAVSVSNIQNFVLENDLGKLDASKPFMPFGPLPVKNSNLYIGCQEALNKPWSEITVNLSWKDTPFYQGESDHFREHYKAYKKSFIKNFGKNAYTLTVDGNDYSDLIISSEDDFIVDVETLMEKEWVPGLIEEPLFVQDGDGNYNSTLIISSSGVSSGGKSSGIQRKRNSIPDSKELISKYGKLGKRHVYNDYVNVYNNAMLGFEKTIQEGIKGMFTDPLKQENFSANVKKGFIKVSLKQSFLHHLFPKIYSVALSKWSEDTLIPNEPYTPLVESINLKYTAAVTKSFELEANSGSLKQNLANYLDESLELFHEHPFGQSEQHTYLKSKHEFLAKMQCQIVPNYEYGELFIGLENAEQLQTVALLVQVLEGSENPEYEGADTFEANERLDWFILSEEEWKPLNNDYIVSNGTDNFLKSGIVKVSIPKEATKNNNRIPGDLFWLKVTNVKHFDTVCQMVNIHAQAEVAQFFNQNNTLSHLETGLPANTISKLVERKATLKGVSQPYSSFGGIPKETDAQFYRRVSERLRHKQRAITIWDYEKLILQQFPKTYKVNCLKHTSAVSELAPGSVTVIVVPNIVNQNVFDIYKPRISKAERNNIQNFVNALNTLHVSAVVENAKYQEVKIALKVKFYEGKDKSFYTKELKKDITKFLAPWAYEETADINFGLSLHESIVIHYIEQLDYVDYIKDFELQEETAQKDMTGKTIFKTVKSVVPANSKVILTSVKAENHHVEPLEINQCAEV